jgi:hypothetical protein
MADRLPVGATVEFVRRSEKDDSESSTTATYSLRLSLRVRLRCKVNVRFGSKADMCSAVVHVRFTQKHGIDALRNPLAERFGLSTGTISHSNHLLNSALWLVCRCLSCVSRDILVAHADCQTTSQGPELRPYNWDFSVEGERQQSRSCWRYSRRKKWEGLPANSHWWSALFGKSPCLALYDRQVAVLRNQLYQR